MQFPLAGGPGYQGNLTADDTQIAVSAPAALARTRARDTPARPGARTRGSDAPPVRLADSSRGALGPGRDAAAERDSARRRIPRRDGRWLWRERARGHRSADGAHALAG